MSEGGPDGAVPLAEYANVVEALRLLCSPVAAASPIECAAETQRRWGIANEALGRARTWLP